MLQCTADERRMKIVEIGGDKELLNMLSTAKDDGTRKAALASLDALSHSGQRVLEGPQLMEFGFRNAISKVGVIKFLSDLFWIGMFYYLYTRSRAYKESSNDG
ncbi:hypothetical protein RIF29_20502 [Crotalaria pallida]|uniref:Uncharacterized protein n=1 Tax=Crotalaria pallida TaxID=3830 RepID=A0AAN9F5N3_CROPI